MAAMIVQKGLSQEFRQAGVSAETLLTDRKNVTLSNKSWLQPLRQVCHRLTTDDPFKTGQLSEKQILASKSPTKYGSPINSEKPAV